MSLGASKAETSKVEISYAQVEQAATRLLGVAHCTPVLTSRTVDSLTGAEVFFKAENFQRTGSFKFRGAYNALASLGRVDRGRGVLAFSSGNHAQGVALAGKILGIQTAIVMPKDAPTAKLAATQGYGAEILLYERSEFQQLELQRAIATERDNCIIPPFDHPDVIAGQGTSAQEFFAVVPDLDLLLVCCGGGGLLSGCAIVAQALAPQCRVIGVEPAAADDATRSFRAKILQTNPTVPQTICDGARTPQLGELTFPIVMRLVHDMVTVSDAEVLATLQMLAERMKLVVEPTAALAAAAVLQGKVAVAGKRVGVMISGGNVDLARLWGEISLSALD
ncbi:MAG: threo-3-hydroxy-L-aspartate ammonia-lyase [Synechococcales cyanobacterium CRU_2_2]|nr:threo-3-hydroxy-L-aspartate ammonia-lyase [Synechococcales cyanobacterium CRU_2_2]